MTYGIPFITYSLKYLISLQPKMRIGRNWNLYLRRIVHPNSSYKLETKNFITFRLYTTTNDSLGTKRVNTMKTVHKRSVSRVQFVHHLQKETINFTLITTDETGNIILISPLPYTTAIFFKSTIELTTIIFYCFGHKGKG